MFRVSLVVLSLAALLGQSGPAAGQPSAAQPSADVQSGADAHTARAAIEAADEAFNQAARARDRDAFRQLLAKDAVFLAGEVYEGRLAFMGMWQHLFDGKFDFRYEARTLDVVVARSGELGWSVGEVATSFTRPGLTESEVTEGHYLNLWRRSTGDEGGDGDDGDGGFELVFATSLVVHPTLGVARDPRGGLMTAWPELADQIGSTFELRWVPKHHVRADSDDVAYTSGEYHVSVVRPRPGDEPRTSEESDTVELTGGGHFLAVWRRDAAGRWQLAGEGFTPPSIYRQQAP